MPPLPASIRLLFLCRIVNSKLCSVLKIICPVGICSVELFFLCFCQLMRIISEQIEDLFSIKCKQELSLLFRVSDPSKVANYFISIGHRHVPPCAAQIPLCLDTPKSQGTLHCQPMIQYRSENWDRQPCLIANTQTCLEEQYHSGCAIRYLSGAAIPSIHNARRFF